LKAINVDHLVNEDSNYCFGEGGAGTYSDGKLYAIKKRRCNRMELLVAYGAPDILVEAHPHMEPINYLKLFRIFEKIIECGGQVCLKPVTDIVVKNNEVQES
jgi:uncharacterized FAD-dependent dehydrogenase